VRDHLCASDQKPGPESIPSRQKTHDGMLWINGAVIELWEDRRSIRTGRCRYTEDRKVKFRRECTTADEVPLFIVATTNTQIHECLLTAATEVSKLTKLVIYTSPMYPVATYLPYYRSPVSTQPGSSSASQPSRPSWSDQASTPRSAHP